MSVRDRLNNESGFTLIELVISMIVLSIIIVPLTSSFLIGLLEANSTRDRVADASSAQAISAYLLSDVQSSDTVSLTGTCLPPPVGTDSYTIKLQLSWTDPKTSAATVASYVDHLPAGSAQHELLRAQCTAAGTTSVVLAAYLADPSDSPPGFKVTCDGVLTCTAPVKLVAVHVRAKSLAPQTQSSYTPFEFDFQARRRVS